MKINKLLQIGILGTLTIASSCGSKTKSETSQKAAIKETEKTVEVVESEKPIDLFINKIKGSWINKDYAISLQTKLSPYASVDKLEGISEAKISKGDVLIGLNNTEAISKLFLELKEDQLDFEGGSIKVISQDEIEIDFEGNKANLLKVNTTSDEASVVDFYVLNNVLSATYKNPNGDEITIKGDGTIASKDFISIKVLSRFDELGDFDLLELTTVDGTTTWYGWEIRNNDLWLYNLKPGKSHIYKKDDVWQKWSLVQSNS